MTPILSIIVAVANDGVIGRANRLPWLLPADLHRFRRLTMGHHLVVGRRTWTSVGRSLPGRVMVVLSRRLLRAPAGTQLASSLDEALSLAAAAGDDELFVGGGGEIYRLALPHADRLYLTRIHDSFAGDTRFPAIDPSQWRQTRRRDFEPDDQNEYRYSFLRFVRAGLPAERVGPITSSSPGGPGR